MMTRNKMPISYVCTHCPIEKVIPFNNTKYFFSFQLQWTKATIIHSKTLTLQPLIFLRYLIDV